MKNSFNAKYMQWLVLSAILALGLAIRVAYLSSNVHMPDFNSPVLDPQLNDYWARALVTGDWTPPPHAEDPKIRTTPYGRPPGYPWLLAGIYWVSGGSYLAPRLVQLCLGLVNVLLVFLLGRRLFGTLPALVAAFLMSVFWGAVYFEEELNSPVWEACFSLSMVLSLLQWEKRKSKAFLVAAGILLGLSALMRPNVLLAGCFVLMWVAWHQRKTAGSSSLKTVIAIIIYVGAASLVILPVISRNWLVSKELVLISYYGGINAYIGNNPESTGVSPEVPDLYEITGMESWNCFNYPGIVKGLERHLGRPGLGFSDASRYFYGRALAFWIEDPWQALRLTLRKAWLFWGPHEISDSKVVHLERVTSPVLSRLPRFTHVLALALAGVVALCLLGRQSPENHPRSIALVFCFITGYFLSIIPFFIAERYRFPVVPFLTPFAGYAVVRTWQSMAERRFRDAAILAVLILLVYPLLAYPLVPYAANGSTRQLHRGIAYAARGEARAAENSFMEALNEDPRNDEAHLQLGYIRAGQGDHDGAMEHYAQAIEANPNNVLACNNLGYEYYLKGDFAQAEIYYRRALARAPLFTLTLNNLGNVLLAGGDTVGALDCFEQVLRIAPRDPFAHYNVGNAYLETGAYGKAVEAYRRAFEIRASADTANNMGLALARSGEMEDAIPWFEKALSLAAEYPLAHFNLANAYGDLGKTEEACRHYDQVLKAWPEHAETLRRKALVCGNTQQP